MRNFFLIKPLIIDVSSKSELYKKCNVTDQQIKYVFHLNQTLVLSSFGNR